MNWRTISAVTAAILILPMANAASANPRHMSSPMEWSQAHNKGDVGRGIERLTQKLDLTPEQSEQIEAITTQSKTDSQALFEQMQTSRQEMQSLLASDASPEQLRQQHQSVQNLQEQLSNNRFETMLQIREVLTPEQRTQMAELMQQRRGSRFSHRRNN